MFEVCSPTKSQLFIKSTIYLNLYNNNNKNNTNGHKIAGNCMELLCNIFLNF